MKPPVSFPRWVFAAGLLFAIGASAQNSSDYKEGYAQGYKDGFDAGYRKAAAEQKSVAEAASKGALIVVTAAKYGPDSGPTCDAFRHARRLANGQRSANVDASNSICGDPAPGKRKSLEITYLCGSVAKTASAHEHRSVYLYCD